MLAEEATEREGRAGGDGDFRFVHRDSNAGEAGHFLPAWSDALTDNKTVRRPKRGKAGHEWPVRDSATTSEGCPLDSMLRLG